MTIIVVSGLPPKWDMKIVVRKLSRKIKGQFEALTIKCFKQQRKCFIRLSELLDPCQVVNNINMSMFGTVKLVASMPEEIPYLPRNIKPIGIPFKLRRALRIPYESTLGQVLYAAHTELLDEMQIKYAGLYNLSKKEDHALLKKISKILLDRLLSILKNSNVEDTAFKLTSTYRKSHPHLNDFQLIVSTLNSVEKALGKPPTQLNKKEFMTPNSQPHLIGNVPFNRVEVVCRKYIKSITSSIVNHLNNLNTEPIAQPTEEQAATLKVREELKKIAPYIRIIIPQVVKDNFASQRMSYYRMRVYGEPYMPVREAISPFLKQFRAIKIFRSDRIHNLLCCKVPVTMLGAMLEADGSVVSGATLFVRLSDPELYKVPGLMKGQMLSYNTAQGHSADADTKMEEDEWNENW